MDCSNKIKNYYEYCQKVIDLKYKCIRPIDCLGNDMKKFTCLKVINYYNKNCNK